LPRSMEQSRAAEWTVHIIEYAQASKQPMASLVYGTYNDPPVDTPFAFVVAQNGSRTVLCDCGFMPEGNGINFATKFGVPKLVSPVLMLEKMGIKREDVTDIVLSHAHFDHAGSIEQFPKAHIYLQKAELLSWVEAFALPPRFSFLTDVVDPDDIRSAMEASFDHRLTLVEGDRDDLLPGLNVRLAKGHTMGQQFITLETARGRYAVAGDCIYSSRNLSGAGCGHLHRYVPLGAGIGSVWDQLMSFDKLEQAVDGDRSRIIILHDETRWSAFEKVQEVEGMGIYKVA
jgi:glyoxylase-like metal-dependent hydrolase (beta-lactamase superfamily II)